ncbi:energy-coupling factor transporter ATPase [Gemella cuniculi]|uniref:energy-coupling factor transporter ATPase n=1 Tax=Gemella cuniculi TaxID=150240 RepID=UPI0004177EE8|nr:energy-coupling factor transporter ATPase [Gemella cuniculi]
MRISLKNVKYIYNDKTPYKREVLKDIDLEIESGSYTVIVGETGSGKSTLIEHINGLLVPSSGEVSVGTTLITLPKNKKERKKLAKVLKELREDVAVLFQFSEQQLFETSVLKDIIFAPLNYGIAEDVAVKKAKDLIKLVGLDESYLEKSPFELSGGEMRKVALCGVLALEPKVLILDEPTVALDYKSRTEIMNLVKDLQTKFNMTIVLVTHNMDYVLEYGQKVIVLNKGQIVFEGEVEELFLNDKILAENSLRRPEVIEFYKRLLEKNIDIGIFPRKYDQLIEQLKIKLKGKENNE